MWPWPLTPKCVCIFLSPSCIYVWNMKAVRWKLVKLLFQNQIVDKVQLWPWPFHPKMYRYIPLCILHLWMKCESWTLKTTQVIVSEPKCWRTDRPKVLTDRRTHRIPIERPTSLVVGPSISDRVSVYTVRAIHRGSKFCKLPTRTH